MRNWMSDSASKLIAFNLKKLINFEQIRFKIILIRFRLIRIKIIFFGKIKILNLTFYKIITKPISKKE